jgi:hypothetical protein
MFISFANARSVGEKKDAVCRVMAGFHHPFRFLFVQNDQSSGRVGRLHQGEEASAPFHQVGALPAEIRV